MAKDRYKDSPTLKRDEGDGKMKATKKPDTSKEEAVTESSTGAMMPVHEMHIKHDAERHELYLKQSKEFMEMHSKHMAEAGSPAQAKIENAGGGQ